MPGGCFWRYLLPFCVGKTWTSLQSREEAWGGSMARQRSAARAGSPGVGIGRDHRRAGQQITHLACRGQSNSSSIPALLISPANGPLKVYALSQATLGNTPFLGEERSRLRLSPAWTPRSPALCLAWRGRWSKHQMQQNCCCLSKTAPFAL